MKSMLIVAMVVLVASGCTAPVAVEGGKMGAQNECGERSVTLSQYNECTEHVDARYRDYETQRKLTEEDGG